MKKLLKKWIDKIDSGTLSETDIIYLKSHISTGHMCKTLDENDRKRLEQHLIDVIELKNGLNITQEQSDKGIEYLTRKMFKVNGKPRNDKWNYENDDEYRDIVKNFSHFKFMGFTETYYGHYSYYRRLSPVYRTFDKSGDYFDYTMSDQLTFEPLT